MSSRSLDANEIVKTLRALRERIAERFPGSGLSDVCTDLIAVAATTQQKTQAIAEANIVLRLTIYGVIAAGIAVMAWVVHLINIKVGDAEIFGLFQGIEAAINIVVLTGAALFFMVTLEDRIKRRRALAGLHELRSIAHVVDMHQLTKDPNAEAGPRTASSPMRGLTRFELSRYLDYCAEMLALTGKLAALYAQNLPDSVVIDAVNEIEQLAANLGLKIWQKIAILEAGSRHSG